jgi:hypothetical protein
MLNVLTNNLSCLGYFKWDLADYILALFVTFCEKASVLALSTQDRYK